MSGPGRPAVMRVACPHCHATPGQQCHSPSGRRLHQPHASRYQAAGLPTELVEENP